MPHVIFVPLTGFRIREQELLALGMSLPGLLPRAKAIGQLPALGLLTLAGMLPEQWTCAYRPAMRCDEELLAWLVDQRPDLVAISALTASIDEAYHLCDSLRERDIATVLGGLHATACPVEAARHATAVVAGSGEGVWRQVLADCEAGRLAPLYRAPRNAPTDEWPLPRFDLLGPDVPRFTLQTERGCPWACDFCAASRLLGPFQEKPAAAVERELAAIRCLDSRPLVELADDNTFAGPRDPAELLATLKAAGIRYFTESDWRIADRPAVLAGLADSGCVQVLLGIESLVFRYPGMGEKQAELAKMMEAAERIQAAGVAVNGCFIVGAEGETRESLDRLTRFLLDCPLAEVQLTLQTPFPGTALYRRLRAQGRLLPERGWPCYTLFDVAYQPDLLSVSELERAFREVVAAVFSPTATERRSQIRRQIMKGKREDRS
ncbi:MAG: cobalamin-dependent protein [Pirellulaceae bacterium]|nr:cobalamin-dependent protein [Pirellulaceae bacterium]